MITISKAQINDIPCIIDLLSPFVDQGIVLERTSDEISGEINNFFIAKENGQAVGTCSFHDYGNKLKEIRSLAVKENQQQNGIGKKLVIYTIDDIIKNESECKIFTLTYVPGFFKKIGFTEVDKNTLPEKIWKDCSKCPKKDNCGETALVFSRRNRNEFS